MMHGIVMDIKKNKAVILKNDGSVEETVNHNYIIGQKINIASHPYRKYVLAAACFVLCFITSISGYALYTTPCSYVYLDINPSLRLDINCFDRIISVIPLNDDAENLIKLYRFKSKNTENCIDEIVAACREKSYLNEDNNEVEVDVLTTKNKLTKKISNSVDKLHKENVNVVLQKINREENSEAINYQTSPKRLKAIIKYTNVFGGNVKENVSKLRGTKIKDIYDEIENKKGEPLDINGQKTDDTADKSNTDSGFSKKYNSRTSPNVQSHSKISPLPDRKTDSGTEEDNKTDSDIPTKRDTAVEEYTKIFGGTTEENSQILKGKTVKEIYGLIKQAADENITSGKEGAEKSTQNKKSGESEKTNEHSTEKRKTKKQKAASTSDDDETADNTSEPVPDVDLHKKEE